jgi:hypothetical protein
LLAEHAVPLRQRRRTESYLARGNTRTHHTVATIATEAGTILASLIDRVETQFRATGRADARELAVALIAACEGIALLPPRSGIAGSSASKAAASSAGSTS